MARILCPVLVGRREERRQLDDALDAARRGRGRTVLVTGPPGIGKSRLVGDLAERAGGRGTAVLLGRSVPSQIPDPYRPLAEALIAAAPAGLPASSPSLAGFRTALACVVPAWREDTDAPAVESPVIVAEAIRRSLLAIAGGRPCLLVLEDLQWADPETLHAFEYLADHLDGCPIACVATLRDDPDTAATVAAARLEARRAVEVLDLRPLPPDEIVEMAGLCLETGAVPRELADLVREAAEGTPFLVEELLAAAAASGALTRAADGWAVSAPLSRIVPESFSTTVHRRLEPLPPSARRLLGAAALLGRRFDWRTAAAAAECPLAEAEAALGRAVAAQLLATQDDGFMFRHALTRDALLGGLLPTDRMALAARCLDALELDAAKPAGWRHLAADLAEAAGESDRAARLLLDAARESLARGALDSSTSALERAAGDATGTALRVDVLEALAEARSAAGDLRGTERVVAALLEGLSEIPAPPRRRAHAHLLLARAAATAARFGAASEALAHARRLAAGADDLDLLARIGAVAAHIAMGEGRPGEAEALAVRAAADAEAIGLTEVLCEALEVATRCARTRDLGEAEEIAARALHAAGDAGLAYWRMRALYQIGVARMFRSGAVETLQRARDEAFRLGAVATATSLDLEIAAGQEMTFRIDECRRTCERCGEMAHLFDLRVVEALAHAFTAILDGAHGSRAAMERSIERALALVPDDAFVTGAIWGDARAVASLAAEDRPRARGELDRAMACFGEVPAVVPQLPAGLRALVIAVDGGEPDFSRASGVSVTMCQGGGYFAYARAVWHGRAGRRREAEASATRGDDLLAGLPWYRNLVRRLAAEAALDDGWGDPIGWLTEAAGFFDETGNRRLASASRDLLRRAGVRVARPTLAKRRLPSHQRQAGVTPREAEVLDLVGEGLPNRDIASRLFLSERTVEQHVASLKHKLGMRTRAELAVHAVADRVATP